MFYRAIPIDPAAARYVKGISLLGNAGGWQVYGCVPNGAVGISIVLSGSCYMKMAGGMERQPEMFVYGLVNQVQWHMISPDYREITIAFHPHILQLFLKERLGDLERNRAADLYALFARETVSELYEGLSRAETDEAVLRSTHAFLKRALRQEAPDRRVEAAHDLIYNRKLRTVGEISAEVNVSAVRLRELFREHVGVSPKELIGIRRINEALRVKEHREDSLTSLAYRLDYFDQAHFIHDFKQATGMTPRQYFLNSSLTSDFYNLGRWCQQHFESAVRKPL